MLVTTKLNTNNEHRETLALEARMTFWDSREIQVAMKKNEKCFLRVTNNIFVIEHASRLPFPFFLFPSNTISQSAFERKVLRHQEAKKRKKASMENR